MNLKKIEIVQASSASYFLQKSLSSSAGFESSHYTIVHGCVYLKAPCGSGTFSSTLLAFGNLLLSWVSEYQGILPCEQSVHNASIYRGEVYSLYSTVYKLRNLATRRNILAYVKALNQTLDIFRTYPESVYATVEGNVGDDSSVV